MQRERERGGGNVKLTSNFSFISYSELFGWVTPLFIDWWRNDTITLGSQLWSTCICILDRPWICLNLPLNRGILVIAVYIISTVFRESYAMIHYARDQVGRIEWRHSREKYSVCKYGQMYDHFIEISQTFLGYGPIKVFPEMEFIFIFQKKEVWMW